MWSSVILLLASFIYSCKGFDAEEFIRRNCHSDDYKYFNDQTNLNIELLCQNFNFTFDESEDIQHRDFIISNKTTVFIENANIETLNEMFLKKFPNAQEITLRYVEMRMDSEQRSNITHPLKTLRIINSRIQGFQRTTAFKGLPNLEMIEISSTTLDYKRIEESLFEGCSKLKKISIAKSEIEFIEENVFKSLPMLRYLTLSQCFLKSGSFHENIFENMNSLEYLDLSGNSQTSMVNVPRTLEFLNCSYNLMSRLSKSDFKDLKVLKELDLSHNQIEDIPEECFGDLDSLETVDLYDNRLHSIPESAFKNSQNLQNLNLKMNFLHLDELPNGLQRIKNLMFEPQNGGRTSTTTSRTDTTTREMPASTTTQNSSTTTSLPLTTTLKPKTGGAQISALINFFVMSSCVAWVLSF